MKKETIVGVLLAGGEARRMGGVNKGAQSLHGRPMYEKVLELLSEQTSEVVISANEYAPYYAQTGLPVFQDVRGGHLGPLSGLETAMKNCPQADWFFCSPVDTPFFPNNLSEILLTKAQKSGAKAVFPVQNGKRHPLNCLVHRSLLPSLEAFLNLGERAAGFWLRSCGAVEVSFEKSDETFLNINTAEELSNLNKTE